MRVESSTLLTSELRWRSAALVVLVGATLAGILSLVVCQSWTARVAGGGLWAALTTSNLVYLARHRTTTVGMMPVSVFSLAPAMAAALCAPLSPAVRALCLTLLVVSGATTALFCRWFARLRRAYARVGEPADDAVIIVLGGAVRGGRPRPTLARRLDVAASLCRQGPARTVVASGGPLAAEGGTEAEAMARYLQEQCVSASHIVLERRARNTAENISNSLELVGRLALTGQLAVLTSDYHLYRAVAEGKRCGVELLPIPARTPASGRLQQWCREVLTILSQGK